MTAKRKTAKKAAKKTEAEKGQWVTKHPRSGRPLYKVISPRGHAYHGGDFFFGKSPEGKTFGLKGGDLVMCSRGFHLTSYPEHWSGKRPVTRTFLAAYWLPEGEKATASLSIFSPGVMTPALKENRAGWCHFDDGDKIVCRRIKLLKELLPGVVRKPVLPKVSLTRGEGGVPTVRATGFRKGKLSFSATGKGQANKAEVMKELAPKLKALAVVRAKADAAVKTLTKAARAADKASRLAWKRVSAAEIAARRIPNPDPESLWES